MLIPGTRLVSKMKYKLEEYDFSKFSFEMNLSLFQFGSFKANLGESGSQLKVHPQGDYQSSDI